MPGYILQENSFKLLQEDGSGILQEFNILHASVSSFTLTGVNSNFTKTVHSIVSVGSFSLTGINVNFPKTLHLILSVGTFTLTGVASLFRRITRATVSVGSFTVTGVSSLFHKTLHFILSVTAFTLNGFPLFKGIRASTGVFIVTVNDSILTKFKELWQKIQKSQGLQWGKTNRPTGTPPFNEIVNLLKEDGFKLLQEDGSKILIEILTIPGDIWGKVTHSTGLGWNKVTKSTGQSWNKITKSTGKLWDKIK